MADKGDGGQEVMSAAELKPLLVQSKRKPVSCAVGMTKDKQGVILLDRRMKPRKLLAEMKGKARAVGIELDPTSLRFGRASVGEGDGGTVVFTVNKAAPGALRPKLIEKLKPAQFQKCEFEVDGALETESEEDGPKEADGPGEAGHPDAAAADGKGGMGGGQGGAADAGIGAPPAGAPDDGSASRAGAGAGSLRSTAPVDGKPAGGARHGVGNPLFEKGLQTWTAVHTKVHADIAATMRAIEADLGADDPDVKQAHATVGPVLDQLDTSLEAKLREVTASTDPAAHGKLVGEAQAIIARYRAFVGGDKIIGHLDQNPYKPTTVRKTLDAALDALANVVKTEGQPAGAGGRAPADRERAA